MMEEALNVVLKGYFVALTLYFLCYYPGQIQLCCFSILLDSSVFPLLKYLCYYLQVLVCSHDCLPLYVRIYLGKIPYLLKD